MMRPGSGVEMAASPRAVRYNTDTLELSYRDKTGDHVLSQEGGGITDAPSDGTTYCRKNAAWVEAPTGSAGLTHPQIMSRVLLGG